MIYLLFIWLVVATILERVLVIKPYLKGNLRKVIYHAALGPWLLLRVLAVQIAKTTWAVNVVRWFNS